MGAGTNILIGAGVIGGGILVFRRIKQRAINAAIEKVIAEGTEVIDVAITKTGELLVGAGEAVVSATTTQLKNAAEFLGISDFFFTAEPDVDPETVEELKSEFDAVGIETG